MIAQLHGENVKFMISVWSNPPGLSARRSRTRTRRSRHKLVDMYNPAARDMRWKFMDQAFFSIGTDAWWQDATEPGDDGNTVTTQVFLGRPTVSAMRIPSSPARQPTRASARPRPDKRVVHLDALRLPGQQRYPPPPGPAISTELGTPSDARFPAGLNFCMTGIPYWTTDTGGFFRPGPGQYVAAEYNELLTRWFEWSTFCPILRIHGYQTHTELWNYPRAAQDLLKYDRLRYRLLPYNYSVAWQVTSAGYTIMRALPMDFRADPAA